jgi:hypothetical protein
MIHLVLGRQGSGKTLFLVRQAYLAYKKGKKIYSNIKLNFPFNELDYQDIIDCKYHDAIILLDEVAQLLPARRSMKKSSVSIVDGFLSMARKLNVEIWGTTQTPRKVDVRFREEADYIYFCDKFAFKNYQWMKVLHNQNLAVNIPLMVSLQVIETISGEQIKYSFLANPYFSMYDTKQIIKVRGLD